MKVLEPEDFVNVNLDRVEEGFAFGLYINGYVVTVLEPNITNLDMDHLIRITGGEILKVYTKDTIKTSRVVAGYSHSPNPNEKITRDVAHLMHKIEENPPFDVDLAPSLSRNYNFEIKHSVYVVNGKVLNYTRRLRRPQASLLARVLNANEYVADFYVSREVLPRASQYRSVVVG